MPEDIVDLEANIDSEGNMILNLNKNALDNLIEQLNYISAHESSGGHVHIDYDSGLEGNIKSIIIIRR